MKFPYLVGRRASATRSMRRSDRRRWAMIWAMLSILSPWCWENVSRSGSRDMVPSSFMISHTTPAGYIPAMLQRSMMASVWPGRARTPPGWYCRGKQVSGAREVPGSGFGVD